jgi:hypothetical protein
MSPVLSVRAVIIVPSLPKNCASAHLIGQISSGHKVSALLVTFILSFQIRRVHSISRLIICAGYNGVIGCIFRPFILIKNLTWQYTAFANKSVLYHRGDIQGL